MTAPEPRPPRVQEVEDHWGDLPPEPSPRCAWWVARIRGGWQPNRRISSLGYYGSAEWYGVWIEEYLSVIGPLVRGEDPDGVYSAGLRGNRKPLPTAYRLLCAAKLEPDSVPREPGCQCQWEAGDSPCPVHGESEP